MPHGAAASLLLRFLRDAAPSGGGGGGSPGRASSWAGERGGGPPLALLIWPMLVLLHIVLVLELCDLHGGLRYLTSKANQLTYGKFHKFRKFPGWSFYEHQCIENATKHIMVFYQIEQNPSRSSLSN